VVASAAYTDTGYQERSRKNPKPSAAHTNNHANSAAVQVLRHFLSAATADRLLEATAEMEDAKAELVSAALARIVTCIASWDPHGDTGMRRLHCS